MIHELASLLRYLVHVILNAHPISPKTLLIHESACEHYNKSCCPWDVILVQETGRCAVIYRGAENNPQAAARKVHKTKLEHLAGHDVFNEDECGHHGLFEVLPGSGTHQQSRQAKEKEMKGNSIFPQYKLNQPGYCVPGGGYMQPPLSLGGQSNPPPK